MRTGRLKCPKQTVTGLLPTGHETRNDGLHMPAIAGCRLVRVYRIDELQSEMASLRALQKSLIGIQAGLAC